MRDLQTKPEITGGDGDIKHDLQVIDNVCQITLTVTRDAKIINIHTNETQKLPISLEIQAGIDQGSLEIDACERSLYAHVEIESTLFESIDRVDTAKHLVRGGGHETRNARYVSVWLGEPANALGASAKQENMRRCTVRESSSMADSR